MIRGRGTGLEDLTEQQRAFSVEWVKTRSPKKALIAGGYSTHGDNTSSATRIRKSCFEYIVMLERDIRIDSSMSVISLQKSIAKLANANHRDFQILDEDTGVWRPRTLEECTREMLDVVESYELMWTSDPKWKPDPNDPEKKDPGRWVLANVKLPNRLEAKKLLGRTMGMFENGKAALPQGVHGGEAQDHAMLSRLSTPELMQLRALMLKASSMISQVTAIDVKSEVLVAGKTGATAEVVPAGLPQAHEPSPQAVLSSTKEQK